MHEHEDRDNYISINWDNIAPENRWIFNKINPGSHLNFGTPYEYSSCMHYHGYGFALNSNIPTIYARDPKYQNQLGSGSKGASDDDFRRLNRMYGCTNLRFS